MDSAECSQAKAFRINGASPLKFERLVQNAVQIFKMHSNYNDLIGYNKLAVPIAEYVNNSNKIFREKKFSEAIVAFKMICKLI